MPLVSVIVAAYNVERYLELCIKSLMRQTCQDLDILLIDDGATDRSGEICDKYANIDSRIRVIHKKNGGISDVRNTGLAQALGKYIMYVDGDDYVAENYVEAAVSCAEKYQADIVIMDFEEIEEATGRRDKWSMQVPRDRVMDIKQVPELLITAPSPCNKLYNRNFWQNTGLMYPLGRNYEDLTMTPRLLVNATRIVYLQSEPLYYYIIHEGSIMRSRNFQKSYIDRKAAIEDILLYFQEQGLYETFRNELEYLAFEHAYFIPIKEILVYEPGSLYLRAFREYVSEIFPKASKNPYVKKCLSSKDKIMLRLMNWRLYGVMVILSKVRRQVDIMRHK